MEHADCSGFEPSYENRSITTDHHAHDYKQIEENKCPGKEIMKQQGYFKRFFSLFNFFNQGRQNRGNECQNKSRYV